MRTERPILLYVPLVMIAFAANSLLGRAGLLGGDISAFAFYAIRIISGAVTLVFLSILCRKPLRFRGGILSAFALSLYAICFTFAYLQLDAGFGALILFGAIQFTMFIGGLMAGERPPLLKWVGMGIGLIGLAMIARPTSESGSMFYIILMLVAGIGSGAWSLLGRQNKDAVQSITTSFVMSVPFIALMFPFFDVSLAEIGMRGAVLATISGALMSGLGYALWYRILPQIQSSSAAVAQLSVPVIAMVLGVILLEENLTRYEILAAAIILIGIATASFSKR